MRNLLTLLLVIMLGSVLPGCHRTPSPQRQAMARAEALMDSLPDSALTILNGIQPHPDASGEERALYALLLSQALDKNYIDVDNDSLVAMADEYYRTVADTRRQMLAAFYHGRVLYNAHDYPRALRLFTEALELATSLSDPFWQARAASELAGVYGETYHSAEEVIYSQKACEYFKKSGVQPHLNYAILNLARAYQNNKQYDKALNLASAVLDSARIYNDTSLMADTRKLMAFAGFYAGKYDISLSLYKKLHAEAPEDREIKALLGKNFLEIDSMAEAKKMLPASIDDATVSELTFLYAYAKRKGDYLMALKALEPVLKQTDNELSTSLDQTFAQTLHDYYSAKQEVRALKLRNARLSNIIVLIICILIAFVMGYCLWRFYKRFKHVKAYYESETSVLRKDIEAKQVVIDEKRAKLQSLMSVKYDVFNQLCQVYYENQTNEQLPVIISDALRRAIDDFSDENKIIAELGELLDVYFDNVFTHLIKDFPKLKNEYKMVFIYSAVGFSTGPATLFLKQHKHEFYYNHRTRLKSRINKSDSVYKEDYLALLK